ncbi:MAG: N-acetylmuramoyl-L-alanine amidase [Longimicrobiales bacterium]
MTGSRVVGGFALAVSLGFSPLGAQQAPSLRVERADGSMTNVAVVFDRGHVAVPLTLLGELGWQVSESGSELTVAVPNEVSIVLRVGSPFFRWDGVILQFADAPYRDGNRVLLPLQLLSDFFPTRLPDLYEYDAGRSLLRAGDPALIGAARRAEATPAAQTPAATTAQLPTGPSPYDGPRVVIIDPGHGGEDPGALGPRGIREKDIALAIALELAEVLRRNTDFEVHLTRDRDVFVDLWERGEIGTNLKGPNPGLFVSIHGNSIPNQRSTRGFETYFLSEARTEHERRVAAIENAPLSLQGQDVDPENEPDLDFILRELRNLDHQHWSNLLAEFTQQELEEFHPGPNRGVKQGVLAVLTNALMPSVLVETGYLSHDEEGRLLADGAFQEDTAEAIARAIERFFERYPPGNGVAPGNGR